MSTETVSTFAGPEIGIGPGRARIELRAVWDKGQHEEVFHSVSPEECADAIAILRGGTVDLPMMPVKGKSAAMKMETADEYGHPTEHVVTGKDVLGRWFTTTVASRDWFLAIIDSETLPASAWKRERAAKPSSE